MNKTISPSFVWTKTILSSSPALLIPFVMLFFIFRIEETAEIIPTSTIMTVIFILRFLGIFMMLPFLLINVPRYLLYKQRSFTFTDTAMLYRMNFISLSKKTIKYRDIKEVTLYRSPLQKLFGLGTVGIITHATTKDVGMKLFNIKEYQAVYDFLMKQVRD